MKATSTSTFCLGLFLLSSIPTVAAREAAPRYKFTAGQTNVFAVEITVRSEIGSEVSTGNVFLVTRAVTTNSATLACRGNLRGEIKRTPPRGPGMMGGYYPGGMMQNQNVFPNDCEITLDLQGNQICDGGDYVLAAPLGKLVQSLYAPLPAKAGTEEFTDVASVLDEPLWLGPADNFMNVSLNGQPMRMRSYMGGYPQPGMATLLVRRQVTSRPVPATDNLVWHRKTRLESFAQTSGEPRFFGTSETDFTFDRAAGLLAQLETQGDVLSQTETTSRHAKVAFKAQRLSGAELAAVLAPPPPPAPPVSRKLTDNDLKNLMADLKSAEVDKQRAALTRLRDAELGLPAPELVDLVASFAFNEDGGTRQSVASFLLAYGTTEQVPVLVKQLKDSGDGVCQTAAKALARLKDERAIAPLAELLAGGVRLNEYNQIQNQQFIPEIASALQSLGAPAEAPVATLLVERNIETRRQACLILKQIGTTASLESLQKVVGDPNPQLNQAAAEAIRAIKQRQ